MFEQFTRNRVLVYLKKNKDYGDSFVSSINALGETAGLVRILDKVNRLKSLLKSDNEVSESLEDTVLDLFNYVVMFNCAIEGNNSLSNIVDATMLEVENYKCFAQRVNLLFGDKEELKFDEEECKHVNNLLWGYVVSLV
ncbi:MAG: DUF1599 domain-containing protein [Peptostreptococcaceae bacterium]|nr:DUF1599 domain-containing protein [Peptostreptococcaceae bacterium]